MRIIIRVAIILMIIGVLFYVGSCIYGNFKPNNNTPQIQFPDSSKARYEVVIVNTGRLLLSSDVTRVGSMVKLDGYWELSGQKYIYRDRAFLIDENVFGSVTVNLRKEAVK